MSLSTREPLKPGKETSPRIVLAGLAKSGKSSIAKVIFQKMPPHETLFLETTHKAEMKHVKHNSLIQFQVIDSPGAGCIVEGNDYSFVEVLAKPNFTGQPNAFVFVFDAQEDPSNQQEALKHCHRLITKVYDRLPKTSFEIFVHKTDGDYFIQEENKQELQQEIHQKLIDDYHLYETCPNVHVTFHATSIYDHSVFEAMSKVVQKLIPELPVLEQLIDLLVTNCRMEKGFLFDVVSKIYIATDSGADDNPTYQCYELCSDMIDVAIDISCIYGLTTEEGDAYAGITIDSKSSCIIQMTNGLLLYLKQVEQFLAFACIIREENFDRQHLMDYNINVLKDALKELSVATLNNGVSILQKQQATGVPANAYNNPHYQQLG
ncbi:unnamed protein product [Amoebophrya sp. A120]|nr:unnamed protein product [Amoebophrya sp. A120]|eukprot:GSA120T00016199001.1